MSKLHAHVAALHRAAARLAGRGVLVVASFGQDPASGEVLSPKVFSFAIGAVKETVAAVERLDDEPHRNTYMPLAAFRPDLPQGHKGREADIVGVFGFCLDFDDDEAARWSERCPLEPSFVVETSAGRYQAYFLLDVPVGPRRAKPVAERLQEISHCDHGSRDLSHVWRLPGTCNRPNAKKAREGRPLAPQAVRLVAP